MKEVKFKVGDLVYCPLLDTKVYQIEYAKNCKKELVIKNHRLVYFFDETGNPNMNYKDSLPFIFHATQENYELLSQLYPNVAFEPPPKRKEPKEIIKAMLESGWEYVVVESDEYHFLVFDVDLDDDRDLKPFDPKTGKTIIDFVDGEVVLESANE